MHIPVLVTGATGFIGPHLVERLLQRGTPVMVVARPESRLARLGTAAGQVQTVVFDGDVPDLARQLRGAGVQLAFHLASHFVAAHRPEDLAPLVSSNLLFGTQLLEAMALAGCTRLVNTGTFWQHARGGQPDPVCLYAATKQAFESMVGYYVSAHAFRVITLKLFDSYGPGDVRPKLFSVFRRAEDAAEAVDMSPGEQLIDLVHVDDIAAAYVLAGERLCGDAVQGSESYAVSSGRPLALREVARMYEAATGTRLNIRWGGRPYRPREVMVPWNTGSTLPGWRPEISLQEGIRRLRAA